MTTCSNCRDLIAEREALDQDIKEVRIQSLQVPQGDGPGDVLDGLERFTEAERKLRDVAMTLKMTVQDLREFHMKKLQVLGEKWATHRRKSARLEFGLTEEMHMYRFEKNECAKERLKEEIRDLTAWLVERENTRTVLRKRLGKLREDYMKKVEAIKGKHEQAIMLASSSYDRSVTYFQQIEGLKQEQARLHARLQYYDEGMDLIKDP